MTDLEPYQRPEVLDLGAIVELTGDGGPGCAFDNIFQTAFVRDCTEPTFTDICC